MRNPQKKSTFLFHAMLFVPVVILFVYNVLPIPAGILMAFQNFQPGKGFLGSDFVGFKNFIRLWKLPDTIPALRNTVMIAVWKIAGNLVVPIAFALLLNEIRVKWFKRTVQTITYLPYFLSWVIVAGILIKFLSPGSAASEPGFLNTVLLNLGLIKEPIYFLGTNATFQGTIIVSDIWKGFGYNSIVYLAALTGIDPSLYEAAAIDGAGRWKQTIHVTLPGIAPTVIIMLILALGGLFNVGFEKVILLYNSMTMETADVIQSFVYRKGLTDANFGYSTAVGLFNSVINTILLLTANRISRRVTETSLF